MRTARGLAAETFGDPTGMRSAVVGGSDGSSPMVTWPQCMPETASTRIRSVPSPRPIRRSTPRGRMGVIQHFESDRMWSSGRDRNEPSGFFKEHDMIMPFSHRRRATTVWPSGSTASAVTGEGHSAIGNTQPELGSKPTTVPFSKPRNSVPIDDAWQTAVTRPSPIRKPLARVRSGRLLFEFETALAPPRRRIRRLALSPDSSGRGRRTSSTRLGQPGQDHRCFVPTWRERARACRL